MPTLPISGLLDNFNRADESPPTGWSHFGGDGFRIVSNQLVPVTDTGAFAGTLYDIASENTDWEWWIDIVAMGTGEIPTIQSLTVSDLGDGYDITFVGTNDTRIHRLDNGSSTQLGATISYTLAAGTQIGMRKASSVISAWADGVELGNRTDATYSEVSKFALIHSASSGGFKADNFGGGNPYFEQAVSGGLTFSGGLTKDTGKQLAGNLTLSGSLVKNTTKILSGVLSFAGSVLTSFTQLVSVGGTLTFSGGLTKNVGKQLGGVLSFIGVVTTLLKTGFSAVSSGSGTFSEVVGGTGTFSEVSDNDTDDFTEVN